MGKQTHYIGEKFGRLTIIDGPFRKGRQTYYLCKCECGNEKEIRGSHLSSGSTQSCGCLRKEKISQLRTDDLTGKTFGRLTVLKRDYEKVGANAYWICQCECGKTTTVRGTDLKQGHTQSCGCLQDEARHNKLQDLTGQVFGYLKVISLDEEKTQKYKQGYFYCQCLNCNSNQLKSIKGSSLKRGEVLSCGCLKSKYEKQIESILIDNNIQYKKEYTFEDLKGKKRNLRFDFAIFNNNKLVYLIEYQGKQHFSSIDFWGGEEKFLERKNYDKIKEEYCNNNNIPLIILTKPEEINKTNLILKECLTYE